MVGIIHQINSPSEIVIVLYNLSDNNDPGTFGDGSEYRYVIIPGGTSLSGRLAGLDMSDYEALKDFYKIPD